jgi:hypothetical protein
MANFLIFRKWQVRKFVRKWPYLSQAASNPKNKGTLLSSTFKIS